MSRWCWPSPTWTFSNAIPGSAASCTISTIPDIRAEFERTCEAVLAIKGETVLLAHDPRLRLSIRLRNPYVDPISLLQVDLLTRWRATGGADEALFQALVATVNGIAAGVQNTG